MIYVEGLNQDTEIWDADRKDGKGGLHATTLDDADCWLSCLCESVTREEEDAILVWNVNIPAGQTRIKLGSYGLIKAHSLMMTNPRALKDIFAGLSIGDKVAIISQYPQLAKLCAC